jgi:hypothetical protein
MSGPISSSPDQGPRLRRLLSPADALLAPRS